VNSGWTVTGTPDAPTITPSVRVFDERGTICHLHVVDGMLAYLGDCRHRLAGQCVPMQDMDA